MDYFPEGYEPNSKDILCGRGKGNLKHEGNQYFMKIIRGNLKRYTEAPKRIDKSLVVSLIVSSLRDEGYNFVRKDTKANRWFHLTEPQVHEKTGHAIRDILKKDPNAANESLSKQAIQSTEQEPDIIASQILSSALKVSKLVEKSQIDFEALKDSQSAPAPQFIMAPVSDTTDPLSFRGRMSSKDYHRRSSMLRLFDELSPEELLGEDVVMAVNSDQPLPMNTRVSTELQSPEMIQAVSALSADIAVEENPSMDDPMRPRPKRSNGSSREFRRSELLQFLDLNEEDFEDDVAEEEPEPTQRKPRESLMQPLPINTRSSEMLKQLFSEQEDIFTNLQTVFGTLPEHDPDQMDESDFEVAKRASSQLGELLKRQTTLASELAQLETEHSAAV